MDTQTPGTFVVAHDRITVCVDADRIASQLQELLPSVEHQLIALRSRRRPINGVLRIEGLSETASAPVVRQQLKAFYTLPFDRVAVIGATDELRLITEFFATELKRSEAIQQFSSERLAHSWLDGRRVGVVNWHGLVAGLLAGVVGFAITLGWLTGIEPLQTLGVSSKPVSILSAASFLAFGAALLYRRLDRPRTAGRFAKAVIVIAVLDVIRIIAAGTFPLLNEPILAMAALSAVLFILFGYGILQATQSPYGGVHRWPLRVAAGLMVVSFLGYAYNLTFLYVWEFSDAISVVTGGVLAVVGILLLTEEAAEGRESRSILTRPSTLVAIVLLVAVQALTALSWRQANAAIAGRAEREFLAQYSEAQSELKSRIALYANVLRGVRGLYSTTGEVTPDRFNQYLDSLNLQETYPGFRAITYIQRVPASQKADYVARLRELHGGQNVDIIPDGDRSEYLPITYGQAGSNYGYDLATSPERSEALFRARKTGEPAVSGTFALVSAPASSSSQNQAFFITIPLYGQTVPKTEVERESQNTGYVNAVFDYATLLGNVFGDVEPTISFSLFDGPINDSRAVYHAGKDSVDAGGGLQHSQTIDVYGRQWRLAAEADADFGASDSDQLLPVAILASGTGLSLLILMFFMFQIRGRLAAVRLAERMTSDLEQERDQAIAERNKDDAILSSIADGVIAIDAEGKIILFNRGAHEITRSDDAVGRSYGEVLTFRSSKTGRSKTGFISRALAGKVGAIQSVVFTRADGVEVPVVGSAGPIVSSSGETSGAIIVLRDVTKEREIDHAKDEFMSLASHQLRTPATAVKQFLGMIREGYVGGLTKDQADMINDAYLSNERQLSIIADMLQVARVDAGRMVLRKTTVDLVALVKEVVDEQTPIIAGRRQTITVAWAKRVVASVDRSRLRMVLENLVSNASKYTSAGGTITASVATADNMVQIEIADTGVGIKDDDIHRLFGKFSRITNELSTLVGGSGLGLYLAKRIIDLHGGSIEVRSTPGKGTTFIVLLPK